MTPEGLIDQLARLVVAHRDRETLELASRSLPTMAATMTAEQITRVADLMHGAEMAVDLEEATAARERTEPGPRVTRSA